MHFGVLRLGLTVSLVLWGFLPLTSQVAVEDHWSPYDYPKEIPEDVPYHIIVDGDTLWDLAAQYLGDPLLWPQLYQLNAYIGDPDLIYPGDPILLNVGVIVDKESIADELDTKQVTSDDELPGREESGEFAEMEELSDETDVGEDEQVGDRTETSFLEEGATEFVILPAGDRSDMECSTYLYSMDSSKDVLPFDLRVMGGENRDLRSHAFGDVVYLNKGMSSGIQPGEVYSVRRTLAKVYHPDKRRSFLGMAIDQVGQIRIVAVQEENATGMIIQSCREVLVGDFLVPYEQEPIPLITELPNADRWQAFPKDGSGTIVFSEDNLQAFGKGHLTNIDLGIENNVAPGDIFIIYRGNPANNAKKKVFLPDIYLGHGVALKTGPQSTVMKVIEVHTNLILGDKVVPLSQGFGD